MDNPATSEDLHRKFNVMASHAFPQQRVQEIARLIDKLEEAESPASLGKALMQPLPE